MNFVFVSTYYSDHETALDFLSRLGNFSSLEGYAHYFKYQSQESIEYIKTLNGIVYDKNLTQIFVFISDILTPDIDYQRLLEIKNLKTLYMSSLTPVVSDHLNHTDAIQKERMQYFLRELIKLAEPLKIFRLNGSSYIIS